MAMSCRLVCTILYLFLVQLNLIFSADSFRFSRFLPIFWGWSVLTLWQRWPRCFPTNQATWHMGRAPEVLCPAVSSLLWMCTDFVKFIVMIVLTKTLLWSLQQSDVWWWSACRWPWPMNEDLSLPGMRLFRYQPKAKILKIWVTVYIHIMLVSV